MLRLVIWHKFTDLSEKCTPSILGIEEWAKQSAGWVNFYHTTRYNIPEDSALHLMVSAEHVSYFYLMTEADSDLKML
jgi:hypothetical protein